MVRLERWMLTLFEWTDAWFDRLDREYPRLARWTAKIWPVGKVPHGPWGGDD